MRICIYKLTQTYLWSERKRERENDHNLALCVVQAIYDEVLEYEDGTPPTASQVSKDITTFLMWTANHEFDDRKRMFIKVSRVSLSPSFILVFLKKNFFFS